VGKGLHYKDERAINAFGSRVRELREKSGMSREEFANQSDIHFTQVARIERGETNVTISYIYRLAEALGVEPASLMRGGY